MTVCLGMRADGITDDPEGYVKDHTAGVEHVGLINAESCLLTLNDMRRRDNKEPLSDEILSDWRKRQCAQ